MKGRIQICNKEDLAELQSISIETFCDTFARDNDSEDLKKYLEEAYNLEKLKKEMDNPESRFHFIYQQEMLAGYLKLNTGRTQTEMANQNGLEVERIYIRKAFKRGGLGRQLLEFAFERAQEEKREQIWLGVWEYNEAALSFYRKFGFKQVGAHAFYVGTDLQTDLIMSKQLI